MLLEAPSLAVEDRLVDVHERLNRSYSDLFDLIVELERREAYLVDGARNMADWLGYRFGYSEHTARELCRIASALQSLPAIADAFREGLLTFDKLRWLTEFCTIAEDSAWAADAVGMSAAQVRSIAVHRRRLAREESDARFKRRYMRIVPDIEEGVVRFWGRLPDAEGMLLKRAVERAVEHQPLDVEVPYAQRCADGLVEMASLSLGPDADPDRATVVCHVDAAVLASEDGVATIDGERPSERRRCAAWPATAACKPSSTMPTVIPSVSATSLGWFRPTCAARSWPATAAVARGRAARARGGCTRTT